MSCSCLGVDADFDMAINDIDTTKQRLEDYLDQQKKRLGCRVGRTKILFCITFRLSKSKPKLNCSS